MLDGDRHTTGFRPAPEHQRRFRRERLHSLNHDVSAVIEEVYWRHRIWPKENLIQALLDAVMSQAQLEKKLKIICASRRRWKITGTPDHC